MTRLIAITWVGLSLATMQAHGYSGGTGEPNDPYQIATAEDLIALGQEPNDYNDCFILTADIDLSSYSFDRAVIAPGTISYSRKAYYIFEGTEFSGSFNGQGYVICNVHIQGQKGYGLFGRLGPDGIITDLGMEGIDVDSSGSYVGGLVGWNVGTITSSYSNGTIRGDEYVGGLVGWNVGTIASSYGTGAVSSSFGYVGGLVGKNDGAITWSYSAGSVSSNDWYVGGLVGRNSGSTTSCFSSGTVNGGYYYVGGLVGSNSGPITSCYCSGTISGGYYVGGLVGSNSGSVASSYSSGIIEDIGYYVGGLVGSNHGSVASSFWDIETSGQTDSSGGTGLTTFKMQDPNTFLNAGWDLADTSTHGTCDFWIVQEGTYPDLAVFCGYEPAEPNGAGTMEAPYRLKDANELGTVAFRPGAYYLLEGDLDLSGITWNTAVVPWFSGHFDGQGYMIRRLRIIGGGQLGLFGTCSSQARISNLGLEEVDVNGSGDSVGGLAGVNYGTIRSDCCCGSVNGQYQTGSLVGLNYGLITLSYNSGTVRGKKSVGGLVGENWHGSITSSCSSGLVNGSGDYVGGLVGWNIGPITSSYSTSVVSGRQVVGGLVGYNHIEPITSSYSIGTVNGNQAIGGLVGYNDRGVITLSFWDTETSSQTESDGGTGLTTIEMQDISTYLNAGWDFIDESDNGTDDLWWINDGQDYPRLWWESNLN